MTSLCVGTSDKRACVQRMKDQTFEHVIIPTLTFGYKANSSGLNVERGIAFFIGCLILLLLAIR